MTLTTERLGAQTNVDLVLTFVMSSCALGGNTHAPTTRAACPCAPYAGMRLPAHAQEALALRVVVV